MKIDFPYTVETCTGGVVIRSPEHLRRLARTEARLSAGFVLTSTLEELFPIVVDKIYSNGR